MKIVQTLWTKPGLKAGWLHQRYHLMSWALSCLQLRQFYDEVELYTDALGKHLLVDVLQLPYTKVHLTLENIDLPTYMWAIPKIITYSKQEQPFLHIDGDVFLWKPLDEAKTQAPLVCQNLEYELNGPSFYSRILDNLLSIESDLSAWPSWIQQAASQELSAFNAGVFGGYDLSFFQEHARLAFKFLENYRDRIEQMAEPQYVNHITEQLLSRTLAKELQIDFSTLFPPKKVDGKNPLVAEEKVVDAFGISPYGKPYIHLVGEFKKALPLCMDISRSLQADYPTYFNRLNDLEQWIAQDVFQPTKIPYTSALKPFFRTINLFTDIYQMEVDRNLICETFIPYFEKLLLSLPLAPQLERIRDVFEYEKARYHFSRQLKERVVYLEAERVFAAKKNELLARLTHNDFHHYEIAVNPLVKVICNKWDWKKRSINDFHANLSQSAGNFPTALIFDPNTNKVGGIKLSSIAYVLVYIWSDQPMNYATAIQKAHDYIVFDEKKELEQLIFKFVVKLLRNHILTLSVPSKPTLSDNTTAVELPL